MRKSLSIGEMFKLSYTAPRVYLPRPDRLLQQFKPSDQPIRMSQDTVQDLLVEYGLDLTGSAQAVSGGGRSQTLLVHSSGGRKIMRRYKPSLGLSTIVQEHSILAFLAQKNFLAPRLVAQTNGQTLLQRDGKRYALFEFIEGGFQYHHYLLTPGQRRQFIAISGRLLGQLHAQLSGFIPAGYNPS